MVSKNDPTFRKKNKRQASQYFKLLNIEFEIFIGQYYIKIQHVQLFINQKTLMLYLALVVVLKIHQIQIAQYNYEFPKD